VNKTVHVTLLGSKHFAISTLDNLEYRRNGRDIENELRPTSGENCG
jgi:hypothetical protein